MPFSPSPILPLAVLTLGLCAPSHSRAAIVVTLPTPTVDGSIVITNDISFTVTTAGNSWIVVFDEWVTSDGGRQNLLGSAMASPISYSINGGATATVPFNAGSALADNLAGAVNAVTDNDGFFAFETGIPLALGDIFTLKAASYTIAAGSLPAGFNPQAQQSFSGNAFLTTETGVALTGGTPAGPVPEPGTTALGAIAGLTLLRRRR